MTLQSMLVLGLAAVMGLAGHAEADDWTIIRLSGSPVPIEEQTMEIVVRLRPETARVFQGSTGAPNATGGAGEVATVLRRFGVNLRPQHPSVSDPELGSYFIVSGTLSAQAEQIAEALRGLGEVEAAYVKPPAELP